MELKNQSVMVKDKASFISLQEYVSKHNLNAQRQLVTYMVKNNQNLEQVVDSLMR